MIIVYSSGRLCIGYQAQRKICEATRKTNIFRNYGLCGNFVTFIKNLIAT